MISLSLQGGIDYVRLFVQNKVRQSLFLSMCRSPCATGLAQAATRATCAKEICHIQLHKEIEAWITMIWMTDNLHRLLSRLQ